MQPERQERDDSLLSQKHFEDCSPSRINSILGFVILRVFNSWVRACQPDPTVSGALLVDMLGLACLTHVAAAESPCPPSS